MLEAYGKLGLPGLPIDECLDELGKTLAQKSAAVLVAPPGAGKTTRVPLALMEQPWLNNQKILMLEPRRLAARSAAFHIAGLIGEKPGETIGYRVRMDSKIGTRTKVEIITSGVFTRMILDDPELTGIGAVLFDEYHERSLDTDLGLALAIECCEALRPDLRLLPMSATLDGAKVSKLLSNVKTTVPIIESRGRSFPVSIRYHPKEPDRTIEETMVGAIRQTLASESGSLLCFLPGRREIERVAGSLINLPVDCEVHKLYGALDQSEQSKAIRPSQAGKRKIVLATSIAETSITIDGVTTVIDSGYSRVPVFEPSTGLTRLATVKASKAAITQRAGRAGRTAPGMAIRLWQEGQTNSLPDYDKPEILEADLTGLVLDLAAWGVSDPGQLRWQDEPPVQAWKEARNLLITLSAISTEGMILDRGKQIRNLALPPRLAHMVVRAADQGQLATASNLAMLLSEQGLGNNSVDLSHRYETFLRDKGSRAQKAKQLAHNICNTLNPASQTANSKEFVSIGSILSFAWPERIAARVSSDADGSSSFRLANGRRAKLDGISNLAKSAFLVVSDLQGTAAFSRIFGAAEIDLEDIREYHADQIIKQREVFFDEKLQRASARTTERLGSVELSKQTDTLKDDDDIATLLIEHLRVNGIDQLMQPNPIANFRKRAHFLHSIYEDEVPIFDITALQENLGDWLLPMISNVRGLNEITPDMVLEGLKLYLGFDFQKKLNELVPKTYLLPSGSSHTLDYEDGAVILRAKVQEFYGLKKHPGILDDKIPLTLEFLSPAMRPIQRTEDIEGFWKGSWIDVRKEMRGRYPKHFWPEDPASAVATNRAKPKNG
ncbi:MAG: ATP-dependent helicase HrpB [Salaquimonas sp.]